MSAVPLDERLLPVASEAVETENRSQSTYSRFKRWHSANKDIIDWITKLIVLVTVVIGLFVLQHQIASIDRQAARVQQRVDDVDATSRSLTDKWERVLKAFGSILDDPEAFKSQLDTFSAVLQEYKSLGCSSLMGAISDTRSQLGARVDDVVVTFNRNLTTVQQSNTRTSFRIAAAAMCASLIGVDASQYTPAVYIKQDLSLIHI